jgi:Protein of unknown function (DUF3043)
MHPKLAGVSLLGRKKRADQAAPATEDAAEAVVTDDTSSRRTTAPKGRPTPKRDTARRRGPVAPAPMTGAEARRRRKAMGGPKLSREERRAEKAEQRALTADRREKMMAGDEAYLLPRDRGPIRRYVRDVVDARRNVLGLFMPAALALIFVMLAVPQVQYYISPAMLVLVAIMAVDGLFLARKVGKLVDGKFPRNTESRWKLGFYAASRASQLRRMRAPRPRVNRGDDVT